MTQERNEKHPPRPNPVGLGGQLHLVKQPKRAKKFATTQPKQPKRAKRNLEVRSVNMVNQKVGQDLAGPGFPVGPYVRLNKTKLEIVLP